MRVIDQSLFQAPDGKISFLNRIQGSFQYGSGWHREMQSQHNVMEILGRALDNRYVLLRNVILPGTDVPIPLILAGPTGVWVMLVSNMRGVFRAKGDAWLAMDGGRFKAAKPNLINRVQLMVRALDTHLRKDKVPISEVRPVLIFTNPGMHVDSVHPAVRLVLSDALDRYVSSLLQDTGVMRTDVIQQVVRSLVPEDEGYQDTTQPIVTDDEEDDIFAFRDEPEVLRSERAVSRDLAPSVADSFFDRINLSGKQWAALFIVFGLWIVLLLVFAVVMLFVL
jgi:hypothetical protein